MKKIILLLSLPLCPAFAQMAGPLNLTTPGTIGAPTVSLRGAGASTTYSYECTGTDSAGNSIGGTTASITNGPTSLSGTVYITVSCPFQGGAASYTVWRTTGGPSQGYLAKGIGWGSTVVDTGLSATAGSPPSTTSVPQLGVAGNYGTSGQCLQSGGSAGADTWGSCGSGGGGVSGSGTSGYVPVWTASTALGNSHIDDGVTTTSTVTSSEPIAVSATSKPSLVALTPSGTSPSVVSGAASLGVPNTVSTAGVYLLPAAPSSGVYTGTNASGIVTTTFTPLQGTDSNVLTSGTVSGTGATLCTDANGGATTTGCSSGGSLPSGTTGQMLYYAAAGTTVTPTSDITDAPSTGTVDILQGTSLANTVNIGTTSNTNGNSLNLAINSSPSATNGLLVKDQYGITVLGAVTNSTTGDEVLLGEVRAADDFTAVGIGVTLGNFNSTSRTTSFTAQTLATTAQLSNGYSFTVYTLKCGVNASATSSGALTLTLGYTDSVGAKTYSLPSLMFSTTALTPIAPVEISQVASSAPVTITGTLSGTATYSVSCALEAN